MTNPLSKLAQAFRADHAVLGRGMFEIASQLRANDVAAARAAAERLDRDAGAHIAFEEGFFYPALRPLIGDADVDRFYAEHDEGLQLMRMLAAAPDAKLDEPQRGALLGRAELMERHVAECGETFGAMGRIPPDAQARLLRELLALREVAPRWTELAAMKAERQR